MARPVAKYTIAAQENMKRTKRFMPTTKKKKSKKVHNPITYNFTKKYIYYYYGFFWVLLLLFVFIN